jgi:hypothetical protein
LAGEEIGARAETGALEWIWGGLETERPVGSGDRVCLGALKIDRRQRWGRALNRAMRLGEVEAE